MKLRMTMLMGLLVGLVAGACEMEPMEDPVGSESSAVIDNDKLPGGCNNPLLCRTTTPPQEDPGHGGSQQMCYGCICEHTAQECNHCDFQCGKDYLSCMGSFPGPDPTGCAEIRDAFRRDCAGQGLTCACPSS